MSAASGHTFSYMNKPSAASLAALATMSRMSTMDGTLASAGAGVYGRTLSTSTLWPQIHHHHAYSADSQQHLLQSSSSTNTTTNSASTNGYGYTTGGVCPASTTNNMVNYFNVISSSDHAVFVETAVTLIMSRSPTKMYERFTID